MRLLILLSLFPLFSSCISGPAVMEPIRDRNITFVETVVSIDAFTLNEGLCLEFVIQEEAINRSSRTGSAFTRYLMVRPQDLQSRHWRPSLSSSSCKSTTGMAMRLTPVPPTAFIPMQGQYAPLDRGDQTVLIFLDPHTDAAMKSLRLDLNYAIAELSNGEAYATRVERSMILHLSREEYDNILTIRPDHFRGMKSIELRPLHEAGSVFLVSDNKIYVLPLKSSPYNLIITPEMNRRVEKHPEQWARLLILPVTLVVDVALVPVGIVGFVFGGCLTSLK